MSSRDANFSHQKQPSYMENFQPLLPIMKFVFFLHPKTLLLIHTNGNRRLSKRGTLENFQICRKQYLVKIYLFRTPSILHLTQMRRVSHLLHKSLFDCLPWSIITSFARKKRWNFKNLRQIVRNSRWFPAQFLIRSRRRRRSATKDESLSDVGAAETCSFFVSVWRNLGLAKSVTAAEKKGLVTDFLRSNCGSRVVLT